MAITFPWTRGTEAARAANSTVPAAGMLAVTNEGNVYAANGSTTWNTAKRLARAEEIAAAIAALPAPAGLAIIDNGDGTATLTSSGTTGLVDNGDGTVTLSA